MYEYVDVSPPRGREEVDVCIAATYSRPRGKDVYDENSRPGDFPRTQGIHRRVHTCTCVTDGNLGNSPVGLHVACTQHV